MKKYEGLIFTFNNLGLTYEEFGLDNKNDMPANGTKCEILDISVLIGESFKDNFYDIKMENGEILYSVSGEHLTLI